MRRLLICFAALAVATSPAWTAEPVSFKQFFVMFGRIWRWNWRVTLAVWGMLIANLLMYFGVITWLPQILVSSGYGNDSRQGWA